MLFLKAKEKRNGHEFIGVANTIEQIVSFFRDWADRHHLLNPDIKYADVYDASIQEKIASLSLNENRDVIINYDEDEGLFKRMVRRLFR